MSRINSNNNAFTYSSKPTLARTAGTAEKGLTPANIMHDRRVVRRNTYSKMYLPDDIDLVEMGMLKELKRRRQLSRKIYPVIRIRYNTPFKRADTLKNNQTDLVYDVLDEKLLEEDSLVQEEQNCRPPTPKYVPASRSKNACSQVHVGDLFVFDLEVKPMLEAIVGRVVEQSHDEVMEEEELAVLKNRQKQFEEIRNGELADLQMRKEQDRRISEEKRRRTDQKEKAAAFEIKKAEDLKIRESARDYVSG